MTRKQADFQQGLHSRKGHLGDVKRQPPQRTSQRRMQLSSEARRERGQEMQSSRQQKQGSFLGISLP